MFMLPNCQCCAESEEPCNCQNGFLGNGRPAFTEDIAPCEIDYIAFDVEFSFPACGDGDVLQTTLVLPNQVDFQPSQLDPFGHDVFAPSGCKYTMSAALFCQGGIYGIDVQIQSGDFIGDPAGCCFSMCGKPFGVTINATFLIGGVSRNGGCCPDVPAGPIVNAIDDCAGAYVTVSNVNIVLL